MCGSNRAARFLLMGDFSAALHANPMAPLVIFALGLLAARAVFVTVRDGTARGTDEGVWGRATVKFLLVALLAQVVVWALRFAGFFGGPLPV
jgi:hypothetical protein